jgi:hypothetical protein
MAFQPKGTGAIDLAAGSSGVNISNGGTVTAVTKTSNGTAYTSFPSIAISAPTTAGGVQAVGSISTMILNNFPTAIASGGTGYTVGDVITLVGGTPSSVAGTFTVATVSGGVITSIGSSSNFATYTALPTNPVSVTGGTGTGATITATWVVGTIGVATAGSGYIEQPTVTFSGGGGSGAAAYATVGSFSTIKSIGSGTSSFGTNTGFIFQTPNTVAPAFMIREAAGADSFVMINPQTAYTNIVALGNANANLGIYANGTGLVAIGTGGTSNTTQFRVSHTASAVNYVQVTGGSTTNNGQISTAGSDTNVGLTLQTKGTGSYAFITGGGRQVDILNVASAVNRMTLIGSAAGSSPTISVVGTDTNIDLALTPKGTGVVTFGTYTAGVLTPTGYVTIKTSDGTTRRLLVG